MGKIKVSKKVFNKLECVKDYNNDFRAIKRLVSDTTMSESESAFAVKAYLNEDGYELEKTPEELVIDKYKENYDTACCVPQVALQWHANGFNDGMEYMNNLFNLGIDFHKE